MSTRALTFIISFLLFLAVDVAGQEVVQHQSLADVPVREVTIFKDGHAFVLHRGRMETDENGDVVIDRLPRAVMGTFWPFADDPAAELSSVIAGTRIVSVPRTALSIPELLEGNVGKRVRLKEGGNEYVATIVSIPERSSRELAATAVPGSDLTVAQKGEVIVLKTDEGHRVVPISRIQDVIFLDEPGTQVEHQELRNLMTFGLDWKGKQPAERVEVGMVYLERGLRWIPSYRVRIDGQGTARIELQATLINEMIDLKDVTTHLVIGVPNFMFKDSLDPISLQQAAAQLSGYFQQDSQMAHAFSNAIMTQAVRMGERRAAQVEGVADIDLGPEISGSTKNEDLFVFTVEHITLRKGQRMVLPVTEFELKYTDLYTLDMPFAPPPEVRRNFNNQQQEELARLRHAPKFMHKIRLANDSETPLTTAPALILKNDRLIAQGMMTYTAIGGSSDLSLTTAVDLRIRRSERETERVPNALRVDGNDYSKIELAGEIAVTSYLDRAVDIEVTRHVLGNMDSASHDGEIVASNMWDSDANGSADWPHWYHWYSWPHWWRHLNGTGRVKWQATLEPGQSIKLEYSWHYYWR